MKEPIIRALIVSSLLHSGEVICVTETASYKLKLKLLKDLNGRILIQPKNQMKWQDSVSIDNIRDATELSFWNANLSQQDASKLCK